MNQNTTDASAPARLPHPKRARRARPALPYVAAAILIALIVAGLWPRATPVETALAATGVLRATVNEEGKTRIKQRYLVSAVVAGQLRRIPFKAGAELVAGETVAVLEPVTPALLDVRARSLAEARRDAASAQLQKAQAAHDFATTELRRFEQLFKNSTVSIQELQAVQFREAASARDLNAAQSALREAEAALAEFADTAPDRTPRKPVDLKAPVTGRVLRVFEESARVVASGTPLLEIGDPADLEVVIEVLSRDGAAIRPGMKVEFDEWGGPEPLTGRVRLVEPAAFTKVSALGVEEQRVRVIADLDPSPNRVSLGDNFRVESRIIIWEAEKVLKVPSGALFRHGDQWAAFVAEGGRAKLRTITVGRTSGTETQVLNGLKERDPVILYPGQRVRDGMKVKMISV